MVLFATLLFCLFCGAACYRCRSLPRDQYPENGTAHCYTSRDSRTCTRKCDLPYFPFDPAFAKMKCGRETNYAWISVNKHGGTLNAGEAQNSTAAPACERPSKCLDLKQNTTELNGSYKCQRTDWASSITCDVQCDLGYFADEKDGGPQVFCGPMTAYRWSYEWSQQGDETTLPGCKKSPVTVEVEIDFHGSCNASIPIQQFVVRSFLMALRSRTPDWPRLGRLINNQTDCIPRGENASKVLVFINVEEFCYEGTCKDACTLLPFRVQNSTNNCHEFCTSHHVGNKKNDLRRIIHQYIAHNLENVSIEKFFAEGGLFSRQASLVSEKIRITDVPYDYRFLNCRQR